MNTNNKVRLNDFLRCLNPDDCVIINLSRNRTIAFPLYEGSVQLSRTETFLNEIYTDLIVINIRYSVLESRYWIKVQENQV